MSVQLNLLAIHILLSITHLDCLTQECVIRSLSCLANPDTNFMLLAIDAPSLLVLEMVATAACVDSSFDLLSLFFCVPICKLDCYVESFLDLGLFSCSFFGLMSSISSTFSM